MEVHAHTHTERKKWTHYLWEFLMLFLAVFCGFLAENQREHMIEHQREKKFASRILSDLKEDTAFLNKRIEQLQTRKIKYSDFLSVMTDHPKASPVNIMNAFFELLVRYVPRFTSTTYDQMKTSGSLRYISEDTLITALQKYYEILVPRASINSTDVEKSYSDHVLPYMIRHFRFQRFDFSSAALTEADAQMFNRTAETDQELINIMVVCQAQCEELLNQQKPALEACKKLIEILKNEYHLK